MKTRTAYPAWKGEVLKGLEEKLLSSRTVGIVDFEGFPAHLFRRVRGKLRGKGEIVAAKNTLIRLALSRASEKRKGLEKLSGYVGGQCALLFSDLPPLELSRLLKEEKEKAPAKPGRISSTEAVLKAGETDFPPGPMVSELQAAGVKARVQAGKVVVLEDFTVVRKGDTITKKTADLLLKLGVEPVELLLRLRAAYLDGLIYSGELLEMDAERMGEELRRARGEALALALALHYPTGLTLPIMVLEAHSQALALARAFSHLFPVKETVPELLLTAHLRALHLSSALEKAS